MHFEKPLKQICRKIQCGQEQICRRTDVFQPCGQTSNYRQMLPQFVGKRCVLRGGQTRKHTKMRCNNLSQMKTTEIVLRHISRTKSCFATNISKNKNGKAVVRQICSNTQLFCDKCFQNQKQKLCVATNDFKNKIQNAVLRQITP